MAGHVCKTLAGGGGGGEGGATGAATARPEAGQERLAVGEAVLFC